MLTFIFFLFCCAGKWKGWSRVPLLFLLPSHFLVETGFSLFHVLMAGEFLGISLSHSLNPFLEPPTSEVFIAPFPAFSV